MTAADEMTNKSKDAKRSEITRAPQKIYKIRTNDHSSPFSPGIIQILSTSLLVYKNTELIQIYLSYTMGDDSGN